MLAGLAAGWVDAVVGGGGLIQLPALVLGLPGRGAGAHPRHQQARLDLRHRRSARSPTTAGSGPTCARPCRWRWSPSSARSAAPWSASHLPKAAFNPILLVVLVGVGAYTLLRPELGSRDLAAVRGPPAHAGGGRRRAGGRLLRRRARPRHRLLPRLRPRRADGLRVPARPAPRPRSPTSPPTSAALVIFVPQGAVIWRVGLLDGRRATSSAATSAHAPPCRAAPASSG